MYWIFSCNVPYRRSHHIHQIVFIRHSIFFHNYYQKIVQFISKTVMRKRSLWVFTSFGGMIYYESKSMFVIYSTRSLAELLYIFSLKVLSHSKLSLHLLFRNKNFANNISHDIIFFHWSRKKKFRYSLNLYRERKMCYCTVYQSGNMVTHNYTTQSLRGKRHTNTILSRKFYGFWFTFYRST